MYSVVSKSGGVTVTNLKCSLMPRLCRRWLASAGAHYAPLTLPSAIAASCMAKQRGVATLSRYVMALAIIFCNEGSSDLSYLDDISSDICRRRRARHSPAVL